MSGIVGIYHRQEKPVQPEQLNLMIKTTSHRGPDGSKVWHQKNVGLGHLMLFTTPESLIEELPYVDHLTDTAITADARIDNRNELFDLLGLKDKDPKSITDSSLILRAYHKWGTECPSKLIGDFAFAIWDGRKQRLFCARDHFGIKPFYYHLTDNTLIFASEIKAILTSPGLHRKLNEDKITDYIIGDFDNTTHTFYQNISRLPAGHCLTIQANSFDLNCYWSLDINKETSLESDAAYAHEFQRLFTEAVECRLRSAFPIGSELSGGLDSSAVSCVARNILQDAEEPMLLQTFSAIFDDMPECDERDYINEVLTKEGFQPNFIQGGSRTPLTDIKDIFHHQDEAFFAPGFAGMTWGLSQLTKKSGVRVLLNGHDGDSTVSHGFGYLHDLAKEGDWLTLFREIRGVSKIYGESAWLGFWRYFSGYTVKKGIAKYKYVKLLFKTVVKVRKLVGSRRQVIEQSEFVDNFNPEFAERNNLAERHYNWLRNEQSAQTSSKTHHYRLLTQGLHSLALEINDKAASAFGIEMRYPFWDKRLVEFCLSLPAEQKLSQGWTRVIMRRGMEGILPPKVQWRTSKMDFTPNFKQGLLVKEKQRLEELILDNPKILEKYVDVEKLRQKYYQGEDVQFIWKAVSLGLWLDYSKTQFNSRSLETAIS